MLHFQEKLATTQSLLLGILGAVVLIGCWWLLAESLAEDKLDYQSIRLDDPALAGVNLDSLMRADSLAFASAQKTGKIYKILPTPLSVVQAFPRLVREDQLVKHTLHSVWLNVNGYFWAVLISILIGAAIGLLPIFRGLFSRPIDALRYLPISALTGLFMLWFGLGDGMKVAFLAFGILVYMIPVVVQRISEVENVHVSTVHTLGASNWQSIRTVFAPSVFSKFMDDLRVLTAISWTYIIIAEILNNKGGLGSLVYYLSRRDKTDKVFAILILIILIGILQDRLFVYLDKRLFPHKYYKTKVEGMKEIRLGIYLLLITLVSAILLPLFIPNYWETMFNFLMIVVLACIVLIVMGEIKIWGKWV